MNISPTDLVLEIGSGHNPKVRSDVLCDKHRLDDTERGGSLKTDRPIVIADGERLPFRAQAFDYVICCHVLEHADDPDRFLKEIMRVGRAGYIESPSEIGEMLYGWQYHHWLVDVADGRLVLAPKRQASPFGGLFHTLAAQDRDFARWHVRYHPVLLRQMEWRGRIDYTIQDQSTMDLNDPAIVERLVDSVRLAPGPGVLNRVWNRMPETWRAGIKSVLARQWQIARRRVMLRELVVCPSCHNDLVWLPDSARCESEGLRFAINDGVPIMLMDGLPSAL
ncbi:methyltransferase domain-containing protein [Candidatus Poribacteria bacterium]|nr:methyltransferase domain-containing protein [Candidatus Poribacteria bacterium]